MRSDSRGGRSRTDTGGEAGRRTGAKTSKTMCRDAGGQVARMGRGTASSGGGGGDNMREKQESETRGRWAGTCRRRGRDASAEMDVYVCMCVWIMVYTKRCCVSCVACRMQIQDEGTRRLTRGGGTRATNVPGHTKRWGLRLGGCGVEVGTERQRERAACAHGCCSMLLGGEGGALEPKGPRKKRDADGGGGGGQKVPKRGDDGAQGWAFEVCVCGWPGWMVRPPCEDPPLSQLY